MLWTIIILLLALIALYFALLRPLLRQRKSLADFWSTADAFEMSLWEKTQVFFEGIKIKLLARLVWVPTALVEAYDKFTQYCGACDLTPIKSMLPAWSQDLLPLVAALLIPMLIDVARGYSSGQPAA